MPSAEAMELDPGPRELGSPGSCFTTGVSTRAVFAVMVLSWLPLGTDKSFEVDVHTAEAANCAEAESRVNRDVGCDDDGKECSKSKLRSRSVCLESCSCWSFSMANNCSW